jgi:hypothetical protein
MAKYSVTTTLATTPTGSVLVANGAHSTNVQVDALAYAALLQSLAGNYVARPTSGTASSTTFLRGDGTWATPAGGSGSGITYDTDGMPIFQVPA